MTDFATRRADMLAMAFNYFYEGWKYRLEMGESYDSIRKDCEAAAERVVSEFEKSIRET